MCVVGGCGSYVMIQNSEKALDFCENGPFNSVSHFSSPSYAQDEL